ncbi:MAG: response regulator transcription factor [Dehalococcoidia bacterium]
MPIRIVLAESNAVLRAAFREYLHRHGQDIEIVGETGDADEAVRQALANKPDVVVLDLGLRERTGWESAKRIHEAAPESRICLVSLGPTGLSPEQMKEHGVCGVLEKHRLATSLVEMIRECAAGLCQEGAGV